MRAIMAIFGAVLGVMLAWTGIAISQDIVMTSETTGEAQVDNPVPIWNLFQPTINVDTEVTVEEKITGVGWVVFGGLIFLIVVGMIIVGFVFFFVPVLQAGMPTFASFAVMLMVFFIVGFPVMLQLTEVFG